MTELSVDGSRDPPQIVSKNLQHNSLFLKKYRAEFSGLIEIGMHKFMLDTLIIDQFEVVGKVQMPDGVDIY